MGLLADDLRSLMDALRIERAVIGGISMGGYVALSLLRRHPERICGLALVDTRAGADTPEGRRARDDMADLARRAGPVGVVRQMLPKLLSTAARLEQPGLADRVERIGAGASLDGVLGALAAMKERPDSFPLLSGIEVPTLVLAGREDELTTPADARAMADAIPNARLHVLPGAGHLSSLERPDDVTAALRELVARCR
jgi:pimeloyl-ACP methyl ester carboxylesterase